MHPLVTAWTTYVARLETQPKMSDEIGWSDWLEDCIVLSDWFNTLRRL